MNKNSKGFAPILIIVILGLLIVVGYFVLKPRGSYSPPIRTSTPTADPTANWNTYTHAEYGFSFRYPDNYEFEETSLEYGTIAWGATISNPEQVIDQTTKAWDILFISVQIRRKLDRSFEEWVENECRRSNLIDIQDIEVSGKQGKRFTCQLGSEGDNISWEIVAINNNDHIYTLTNTGYKRDAELDMLFNQILSTFQFIE